MIPLFRIESLSYRYPTATGLLLDSAECTIKAGELVNLVGLAEAGKSTLCKILKGFLEPTAGQIAYLDSEGKVRSWGAKERLKRIGWTPPQAETAIFAETVFDEIAFGLRNQAVPQEEIPPRVAAIMELTGLRQELTSRHPQTLSGGEKRRVALASVAVMDYLLYIFDEPTAGLDYDGVLAFHRLIGKLTGEGKAVIRVGHDLGNMLRAGGRFVLLENGKLWETVKAKQYLERYESI